MTQTSVYNWFRQQRIDNGEEDGTTNQAIELKATRKRLKQRETDQLFLAKSMRFPERRHSPKKQPPVMDADRAGC